MKRKQIIGGLCHSFDELAKQITFSDLPILKSFIHIKLLLKLLSGLKTEI